MTERDVHALRAGSEARAGQHRSAGPEHYGPIDLDIFMGFAHVAAAVYMAHGGPEWLQTLG